jgi:hypothetical protein
MAPKPTAHSQRLHRSTLSEHSVYHRPDDEAHAKPDVAATGRTALRCRLHPHGCAGFFRHAARDGSGVMPWTKIVPAYQALSRAGGWHLVLVTSAVALTWGFLASDLRQEYRDAVEGARRETSAIAQGLEETTAASFDMIDQTLKDLREAYGRDPATFNVRNWFGDRKFGTGLIIQASIVGPDDIVLQSNLPVIERTDLSDREHIRIQKESLVDDRVPGRGVARSVPVSVRG